MPKSRAELDKELDALAAWVPTMVKETQDDWHLEAFAAMAGPINDATSAEDHDHVWGRIQKILSDCWTAAGFTDTEFRCDDETGGGQWVQEGSSVGSSSLRQ